MNLLKLSLIWLDYRIKNFIISLLSFILFKPPLPPEKIKKVLVFRTGSIGDSIVAYPALYSIRQSFPQVHITLLTKSGKEKSLAIYNLLDHSLFDDFVDYSDQSSKAFLNILRATKADLFIELSQSFVLFRSLVRNMLVVRWAGIKSGIGWEYSSSGLFPKTQSTFKHFLPERERLLHSVCKAGIKNSVEDQIKLQISELDEFKVQKCITQKGISENKNLVAIVPGAQREANTWPIENFIVVAQYLAGNNLHILLIGGKSDTPLAKQLAHIPNVYDFTGQLSPMESATLLKKCTLTISNDTGPMHLSYAVGTPVIALFSNRDYPNKWYPPENDKNFVFRAHNIPCEICLLQTCNNDKICMTAITPEMVLNQCRKMLNIQD